MSGMDPDEERGPLTFKNMTEFAGDIIVPYLEITRRKQILEISFAVIGP